MPPPNNIFSSPAFRTELSTAATIRNIFSRIAFDIDYNKLPGNPEFAIDAKKQSVVENFNTLKTDYFALKNRLGSPQGNLTLLNTHGTLEPTTLGTSNPLEGYASLFRDQLNDMARYPSGQRLLTKMGELMAQEPALPMTPGASRTKDSPFRVLITNKDVNQYHAASNTVKLNFWGTAIAMKQQSDDKVKLFSVYPLVHGRSETPTGEQMIESRDGLTPYYISVFHEFNHYKDNKDPNANRLVKGIEQFEDMDKKTPIYSRTRSIIPGMYTTFSPTEHRTIFDGSTSDTSELSLRLESGEPIRYLYQSTGNSKRLYEPVNTVFNYATTFAPEREKELIKQRLGDHLNRLPLLPIQAAQADALHMKVRLSPLFPDAFSAVSTAPKNKTAVSEFVSFRTSQARVGKVKNSIETTSRRLNLLDSYGESFSTPSSETEILKSKLASNLRMKLGRRENELNILRRLGIVDDKYKHTGKLIEEKDYSQAYRMLLGLEGAHSIAASPQRIATTAAASSGAGWLRTFSPPRSGAGRGLGFGSRSGSAGRKPSVMRSFSPTAPRGSGSAFVGIQKGLGDIFAKKK